MLQIPHLSELSITPPSITINEPNGVGDTTNTSYLITWLADDSEEDASISLFYDSNNFGSDGILIASGLSENATTSYTWNTTAIPDGSYYIYGIIDDGENSPVVDYSSGKVTINHNGAPAITITEPNGTGDNANQSFVIKWNATDPDDDAAISLFYDLNNFGQDGTLIVSGLSENSTTTQYTWNTGPLPAKDYFIYAIIDDGVNAPVTSYSTHVVKVRHNGGK